MSVEAGSDPTAGSPWAKGRRRSAARHHPVGVKLALMGLGVGKKNDADN
jgi:hypothetical protein